MKHHMKTVNHQLEAKKYTITEESMKKTEVQVILIEADLFHEIRIKNTPQILTTEAPTEQTNKLIVIYEMNPDIGPIIWLNTLEDIPDQPIKTTESTDEQEEEKTIESDDPKNNAEIENVVKNLLRAINEDQAQNTEDEKNKIITQYYQDDEIVDLEIDDWLIMDQWGNTPALEDMIPVNFEDLWNMVAEKEECINDFERIVNLSDWQNIKKIVLFDYEKTVNLSNWKSHFSTPHTAEILKKIMVF